MSEKVESLLNVEFKIFSENLNIETLTKKFGIEPDKVFIKGEPINHRMNRVHEDNMWSIKSKIKSISYEEHIHWLLNKIEPAKKAILAMLADKSITYCEFSCYFDAFAKTEDMSYPIINFNYKTLAAMTELQAKLDIDII